MKVEDLKPDPRDRFYVDFDTESGSYGVFGSESGFCYGLYSDRADADAHVAQRDALALG